MSQKTDKMLKLALVFFISLLSFSIGTFVGKKYSDNQHKLATLEPHAKSEDGAQEFATTEEGHEAAGEHTAAAPAKKEGDAVLTDHEVAKIAEEFATDSNDVDTATEKTIKTADSEEKDIKEIAVAAPKKATAAVAPKAEAKHTEAAATTPTAAKHEATTHEVAATKPAATTSTARAVASIPPATAGSQYTVQVGSFATTAEAQKLSQDLMNKGYKASFVSAQVNGQTWNRVQVGIFGSVKEAQDYKKDFLEKTHLTSAIVQRVQK
ncbi:MAG: SPOR domain-containing protein [Bdellovibrio sp.]|nr:SPOR domain-containing protein [Bdellovibrio sp.]